MPAGLEVELLYFAGCPNHDAALGLVERVAAEVGAEIEVRRVEVTTSEAAAELRFLGSPTIRVNGRDVEPGADDRDAFVLACRVYRTESGLAGQPSADWVRAALTKAR